MTSGDTLLREHFPRLPFQNYTTSCVWELHAKLANYDIRVFQTANFVSVAIYGLAFTPQLEKIFSIADNTEGITGVINLVAKEITYFFGSQILALAYMVGFTEKAAESPVPLGRG